MGMREEGIPVKLRCEYAENPLGVGNRNPRFSWQLAGTRRGIVQKAYRILVSSSGEKLAKGIGDLWDSGRIASNQAAGIRYAGAGLISGQQCWWKVCTWDGTGTEGVFSEAARFEMGLLNPEDWKGNWLGFTAGFSGGEVLLRKEFELKSGILKARVYIAAAGYYELRINGRKVGDHVLDPGFTDYTKRVLYATYDVTAALVNGKNVIGIELGNGWYGAPRAILQLNVELEDGTRQEVVTHWKNGWKASDGPIINHSLYDGEVYDARLEKPGWDKAEYDMERYLDVRHGWIHAMTLDAPGGELVSQMAEPIRVVEELQPVEVKAIKPDVYVYDLGQNMAGWVQIQVEGPEGAVIVMRHAEEANADGSVNQDNLRTAACTDKYILKGSGIETYAPKFTYHGFRYVQVELSQGPVKLHSLRGQVVRSAVVSNGEFECSHALINRIHRNVRWTEADNLHSVPTDCPQRDERMGWLNDATVRAEEAVYNYDFSRFYEKWLQDIADTQDALTGAITDTAPFRWGSRPADPVSTSYLLIPLFLYKFYGNRDALEAQYKGLKKWVQCLGNLAVKSIISHSVYGDWSPPIRYGLDGSPVSAHTPGALVSTAYYYYDAVLMQKIARILGKMEDEKHFADLASKIKQDFNLTFFDAGTNQYGQGSQASNALALLLGLVPDGREGAVLQNLVHDIEVENDMHLSTGNQCTKHVIDVLTEMGRQDIAFALVTQTTYPSWGFMIEKGATTIWERWEDDNNYHMNSRNHPMMASIGAWFYKSLAGIRLDEEACGFDRIVIKPFLPKGLTYARASLETVKGMVTSGWELADGRFSLEVTIPANSAAQVHLPMMEESTVTESHRVIWKDGVFAEGTEGVHQAVKEAGRVVVSIGSGSYCFSYSLYEEEAI